MHTLGKEPVEKLSVAKAEIIWEKNELSLKDKLNIYECKLIEMLNK
jgi:hypothetical protein